jgi:uncharacterized membrane protein
MIALRYVYVLALVVWVGGLITIGGVVAPAAFAALGTPDVAAGRQAAAAVVGEVLRRFHPIAYTSALALLASLGAMAVIGPRPIGFGLRIGIIGTMLVVSLASGLWIDRQIATLRRAAVAPMATLPPDDPRRIRFGQLHGLSTALMALNLLGGLTLLYWETRE